MHRVRIEGNHREMGLQQGRGLKEAGFILPRQTAKMIRFAGECKKMVEQYAPELLEEIQGISEGARLDYEALKTFTLTAPFEPQDVPNCTAIAITPERTKDNMPIVGRNYDFSLKSQRKAPPHSAATLKEVLPAWATATYG